MNISTYNVCKLENSIFSLFLGKLKTVCKNREQKLAFNNIIIDFKGIQELKNKSNISKITEIINSSMLSTNKKLVSMFWKESIEEVRKKVIVKTPVKTGKTCAICLDKEVDIYIIHSDIMHACVCSECTFELMISNFKSRCPLCRVRIEKVVSIIDNNLDQINVNKYAYINEDKLFLSSEISDVYNYRIVN